ncbi:hypothetical protein OUZ56_027093 [Daphnia magna]|uniref:Secreted protein n=1 Tax=Daphnia magna TaxID=35525 RepID=A0ABQ9ZNT2_9CRUS|nr:hypothetical protein OUZ56_027093 [Daphnia magna]
MPSQPFAAFIALLSLTTYILLCQRCMPSPHYERRPVVIMPPYGIKNPSERGQLVIFADPKQLTAMAVGATWNFSSVLGPRALFCPMG